MMVEEITRSERVVQESIQGKDVTLMHLIANPDQSLLAQLELDQNLNAIGLITISPCEAAIIAADLAVKSGAVNLQVVDRFNGTVVINGPLSDVEFALKQSRDSLANIMKFSVCPVTRS